MTCQHKESPGLHFMMVGCVCCRLQHALDLLTIRHFGGHFADAAATFYGLEYSQFILYSSRTVDLQLDRKRSRVVQQDALSHQVPGFASLSFALTPSK